jgi:hypothetical protein
MRRRDAVSVEVVLLSRVKEVYPAVLTAKKYHQAATPEGAARAGRSTLATEEHMTPSIIRQTGAAAEAGTRQREVAR